MRKRLFIVFALAAVFLAAAAPGFYAQGPSPHGTANYNLAAQWSGAKVGRLVFDATVSPRWLETGGGKFT